MIIRDEHVGALADDYLRRWKLDLRSRLREVYPERTASMSNDELETRIERGWAEAVALLIEDYEDRNRLIELEFALTPDQLASPFVQSVILRVLNWLERPGRRRLDFLYANLVSNPNVQHADRSSE